MKIKILGTRANVEASKPWHSKHSGVLVDGRLLFDLGEREFLDYDPQVLFFTHLHPDHAFFVREKEKINLEIPVYAPEESRYLDDIQVISEEVTCEGYSVTPIPAIHSLKVDSLAYLIEKDGKKVLYTGDLVWIEKEYHDLFEGLDLVITEASTIRKDGLIRRQEDSGKIYGHAGVPRLVNLFKSYTRRIVFLHFGTWFLKDVPAGRKKIRSLAENGLELDPAHDGKEYQV